MLDRIRRPVEQQIAQHASANTGEHSQRRDSEQVEALANTDGRTRRGEHRNADVVENYLKHACARFRSTAAERTQEARRSGVGFRGGALRLLAARLLEMDTATVIVTLLLAALFTFSASIKLLGVSKSLAIRDHLGVSPIQWR